MSPRLRDAAVAWLAAREPAVVVEVRATRGSVPRETGTRMLVSAHHVIGTIGGGHLEWKALQRARAMLPAINPESLFEHYPLGPALGQCCGGSVTLAYSILDDGALARWPVAPPAMHLQLYGAGHVGRAIATQLALLDASVDWIDEREAEFPATTDLGSAWPAHIRRVCVDAVEAEVAQAPPGAFFLVLTHRHDLDLSITEAILRRADFGFLGLIGSKTKKQRFAHHFERRGIAADSIARVTCPIGIPGIGGKEPEVIAVAVVAQLLQVAQTLRASGAGTALRESAPAIG